jgi:hypothetical protein
VDWLTPNWDHLKTWSLPAFAGLVFVVLGAIDLFRGEAVLRGRRGPGTRYYGWRARVVALVQVVIGVVTLLLSVCPGSWPALVRFAVDIGR